MHLKYKQEKLIVPVNPTEHIFLPLNKLYLENQMQ